MMQPLSPSGTIAGSGARRLLRMPSAMHSLAWAALFCAFAVLVSANSGGYRYGVSDQAFYLPVLEDAVTPALFPHDGVLLDSQSRLTILDELLGAVVRATGISLPALCLAGYLATLAVFVTAVILIGNRLYISPWTTVALLGTLTLRHRIAETGVNTFEGYFHPRVLAFAVGLLAVACVLRRERVTAILLIAAAMIAHPTTGGWFGVWIALGAILGRARGPRVPAGIAVTAAAGVAAAYAVSGIHPALLPRMDAEWLAVLSSKDYLFPNGWSAGTWLVNALAPAVLFAGYAVRARQGLVSPEERAVALGCGALVGVFLVTLPLVASAVAVAVQLQISRVLWQVELMATVYLVWLLVEWKGSTDAAIRVRAVALTVVILAASAGRGYYILNVHFDRPLVQATLPRTDWTAMADWVSRQTPVDAGFLADPQHSGRYGVSFRIAAKRDVFLEAVKDSAIAIYSRDIALRVRTRLQEAGQFDQLTPEDMQRLARTYGMDYVITERTYPLPLVHKVGRLHAYRLGG